MSKIRSFRLRDEEMHALEEISDARGVYVNGLVRIAVRALVGLPNPEWATALLDKERDERNAA